jgi:hypothetical protein
MGGILGGTTSEMLRLSLIFISIFPMKKTQGSLVPLSYIVGIVSKIDDFDAKILQDKQCICRPISSESRTRPRLPPPPLDK